MDFAYLLLAFYREYVVLIAALVWPAVVAWALLQFKSDLSALIARIKSAKGLGVNLEFGLGLSIAEDTAYNLSRGPTPTGSEISEARMIQVGDAPMEAYVNPSQVIRKSFIKTVTELRRISGKQGQAPSGRLLYVQTMVELLSKQNVLSVRQAILIKQLQLMRDRATPGSEISPENVQRFLQLNEQIRQELSAVPPIVSIED